MWAGLLRSIINCWICNINTPSVVCPPAMLGKAPFSCLRVCTRRNNVLKIRRPKRPQAC